VYGISESSIVTERTSANPINFYGYTKKNSEELLLWYQRIHGISYISLRYFNVAGDGGLQYTEKNPQNIFPILLSCIQRKNSFTIFGTDYNTPDGTCIRDYVHVTDLVQAHILALVSSYCGPLNLGTGKGSSVKEVIASFNEVFNTNISVVEGDRRPGDSATLVASSTLAEKELGWKAQYSLKDMVASLKQ